MRRVEATNPDVPNTFESLAFRKLRHGTRDHRDFVASLGQFLREPQPHFFDRAAHNRRNRQKCSEDDRDPHSALRASHNTSRRESVARSISKLSWKHFCAFTLKRT